MFLGTASFATLDYRQIEPLFVRALELLDGEPIFERFGLAGYPAVIVRAFLARIYAEQGKFEQGIAHGQDSIRIAHAVEDPYSLTIAYWCLAELHVVRGEFVSAITLLERALAVAREFDLPYMSAGSSGTSRLRLYAAGADRSGAAIAGAGAGCFRDDGASIWSDPLPGPLGEAYMLAGRHEDAFIYATRALAMARESGQRRGEANALHLLGEVAVHTEPAEHAECHYRDALALALEIELRPLSRVAIMASENCTCA